VFFTFTCAAVVAAMQAAAELANLFNEPERRTRYEHVAAEIRDAMMRHLWLDEEGHFARGFVMRDDFLELDRHGRCLDLCNVPPWSLCRRTHTMGRAHDDGGTGAFVGGKPKPAGLPAMKMTPIRGSRALRTRTCRAIPG